MCALILSTRYLSDDEISQAAFLALAQLACTSQLYLKDFCHQETLRSSGKDLLRLKRTRTPKVVSNWAIFSLGFKTCSFVDQKTMNGYRRQTFCGFMPSVERMKDERYGKIKARKYSEASIKHKINRPPNEQELGVLRRSVSLPDCQEMARIHSRRPSRSKAVFSDPPGGSVKRTRSVSFAPEVVFFTAVAENDVAEVTKIIHKEEIDLNHQSPSGLTALHYAAAEGSFECVQLLIDCGAEVELLDSQGCSALDFAVRGGHFDCASYLIKAGAEIKKIVNGL